MVFADTITPVQTVVNELTSQASDLNDGQKQIGVILLGIVVTGALLFVFAPKIARRLINRGA